MARELYNWDQVRAYLILAVKNVKDKNKYMDVEIEKFISELDPLQTRYGKEGVVGLAQRYLKNKKDKRIL